MLRRALALLVILICINSCNAPSSTAPPAISINNVAQLSNIKSLRTGITPNTSDLPQSLEYNVDGRALAAIYKANPDYYVAFWDILSWKERGKIRSGGEIWKIHFSSSSLFLVITQRNLESEVELWDLNSAPYQRRNIFRTSGFIYNAIYEAVVNPKFYYVATAGGGTIKGQSDFTALIQIWDVQTGQEINRWTLPGQVVAALKLSHNSNVLALGIGDDRDPQMPKGSVQLYDAEKMVLMSTLTGFSDEVEVVEFSSNDNLLAVASRDGSIQVWDIKKKQLINTFNHGAGAQITAVSFGANDTMLTSSGGDVKLWDIFGGKQIGQLKLAGDLINYAKFSPDSSSIAATSLGGRITIWAVR